ncbi:hypothetical protein [Massilia sp. DD77]
MIPLAICSAIAYVALGRGRLTEADALILGWLAAILVIAFAGEATP